jgi:hypothetical protein
MDHSEDIAAEDPICQVTAVALNGIFAATLHRHLNAERTVFGQILHREAQQGAKNLERCERYLTRWLNDRPPAEQQTVLSRIEACVGWFDRYTARYSDLLSRANVDGEAAAADAHTDAQEFFDRIAVGAGQVPNEQTVRVRSSTGG